MVVPDQQVIARHLAGRVAVADMPGQPRQVAGNAEKRLGRGDDLDQRTAPASSASPSSSDTVSGRSTITARPEAATSRLRRRNRPS
jgi:hypothetical protein